MAEAGQEVEQTSDSIGFTMESEVSAINPATLLRLQKRAMDLVEKVYTNSNEVMVVRMQVAAADCVVSLLKQYEQPSDINAGHVVRASLIWVLERYELPEGGW